MLISTRDSITQDYDITIIGSGLAGMTAANILGKRGHKVLLLEAHNKLGGFATWFYRDSRKHVFDISLHGFPVGMIKTCKKYWSKEIASLIVQLKKVRFINPQFELETEFTKEDFTEKLVHHFKVSRETVTSFFDYLAQMNFYDQNQMTNQELFEKFFPGRNDVVRFLMEPITYANGSTLDDPAISYGIVFSNFMSKGVYTFSGGTDNLVNLMKTELLKNNVDIKLQAKVEKIIVENNQVVAVKTTKDLIKSKAVLSNANILTTIKQLVGQEYFDQDYLTKLNKVRINSSSCQVYFGLKPQTPLPDMGELIFTSTHPSYQPERLLDLKVSSRTFSIYYPEARPQDSAPRPAIVSSTNSRFEDWERLTPEEYQREKAHMIEDTIEGLEKIFPSIRDYICHIEAATPLTVKRYTHHPKGTSFGTKFEGLDFSMNLHKKIRGLFHSGSVGIIMSGWLGAANYGAIQSNNIESYLGGLE